VFSFFVVHKRNVTVQLMLLLTKKNQLCFELTFGFLFNFIGFSYDKYHEVEKITYNI